MKIKILAVLFMLFIIAIVIGADNGSLALVLRGIYDFPNGDKLGHFGLYGMLAFLLALAFPRPLRLGRVAVPMVILALLMFAALEEYSQQFFPTRTADVVDLTFSFLGIAVGAGLAAIPRIKSLISG